MNIYSHLKKVDRNKLNLVVDSTFPPNYVDKVKSIGLNIKNKSEKIKEQANDIKYEVINRTIRFKENTCHWFRTDCDWSGSGI